MRRYASCKKWSRCGKEVPPAVQSIAVTGAEAPQWDGKGPKTCELSGLDAELLARLAA